METFDEANEHQQEPSTMKWWIRIRGVQPTAETSSSYAEVVSESPQTLIRDISHKYDTATNETRLKILINLCMHL